MGRPVMAAFYMKGRCCMRKTIYMSDPLIKLAEKTRGDSRRTSGFSRRLGEIVERYQIMLDIDSQKLPALSDSEMEIMGEVVMGAVINARKIRGLHLDSLDATLGTPEERKKLAAKIEQMTAGQRLTLVEKVEGQR